MHIATINPKQKDLNENCGISNVSIEFEQIYNNIDENFDSIEQSRQYRGNINAQMIEM